MASDPSAGDHTEALARLVLKAGGPHLAAAAPLMPVPATELAGGQRCECQHQSRQDQP